MRKSALDPLLRISALLLISLVVCKAANEDSKFLEEFCKDKAFGEYKLSRDKKTCSAIYPISTEHMSDREVQKQCWKMSPMTPFAYTKAPTKITCHYKQEGRCNRDLGGSGEVFMVRGKCIAIMDLSYPTSYNGAVQKCRQIGASVLGNYYLGFLLDYLTINNVPDLSFWFDAPDLRGAGLPFANIFVKQTKSDNSQKVFVQVVPSLEQHHTACIFDAEKNNEGGPTVPVISANSNNQCSKFATRVGKECKCKEGYRNRAASTFKGQYCDPCRENAVPLFVNILVDNSWKAWHTDEEKDFEMPKNALEQLNSTFGRPHVTAQFISYGNLKESQSHSINDKLSYGRAAKAFSQQINTGEPPKRNNIDDAINHATANCKNINGKKCISLLLTTSYSYATDCTDNECNMSSKRNESSYKTMYNVVGEAADSLRATGSEMWVIQTDNGNKTGEHYSDFATPNNVYKIVTAAGYLSDRLDKEFCDHSFD